MVNRANLQPSTMNRQRLSLEQPFVIRWTRTADGLGGRCVGGRVSN